MTFKIELGVNRDLMAVLARWCQAGPADSGSLDRILKQLEVVRRQGEQIMATQQQFQDKLDTINANTSRTAAAATVIGERMTALREEVKTALENAGVSAAEEEVILGHFDPIIAATGEVATFLEGVAADPTTEPPPVEPPVEEPPVEPPVE